MEHDLSRELAWQGLDHVPPLSSAKPDRGRLPVYPLAFLAVIYAYSYLNHKLLSLLSGTAFAICYAIADVPIARLADRVGRRSIIGVGFLFWSAATAATGFAAGAWSLAASRILTGVGEAAGVAPAADYIAASPCAPGRSGHRDLPELKTRCGSHQPAGCSIVSTPRHIEGDEA
jgi:MFS family permease